MQSTKEGYLICSATGIVVLMDTTMKAGRIVTVRSYKSDDFEHFVSMFQQLSKEARRYGLPPYDRARLERWILGLDGGIIFDPA